MYKRQVLGLQGLDPKKFTAFNVLEDPELRQGRYNCNMVVVIEVYD